MKVYVAAEQKDLGIRIANMLNRSGSTCIISDEPSGDYRVLLSDIKGAIQGFNAAILISKAPLDAAIEANRMGGIRATVCKDMEDVGGALRARANLIIFDSAKVYKMDTRSMLKSIQDYFDNGDAGQVQSERRMTQAAPARMPPVKEPQQKPLGGGNLLGSMKNMFGVGGGSGTPAQKMPKVEMPKRKPVEKEPQKSEEMLPPKKRGKGGLFGSLKDTFGVE